MTWRDAGGGSGVVLTVEAGDWLLLSHQGHYCDLIATGADASDLEDKAKRRRIKRPFLVRASEVRVLDGAA